MLNSLFLVEKGLLPLPILYLSRYIIAHKADYYQLLLAVTRDNAWEPWLLYVPRAVEDTAAWTTAKIGAILPLSSATADYVRHKLPKLYSRELVDVIFEQPYCRMQISSKPRSPVDRRHPVISKLSFQSACYTSRTLARKSFPYT